MSDRLEARHRRRAGIVFHRRRSGHGEFSSSRMYATPGMPGLRERIPAFDYLSLHAKRELLALRRRLDLFGRELGLRSHEADPRADGSVRERIQHDPRLRSDSDPACFLLGKEESHVDVVEIDDGEGLPSRGKNLSRLDQTILDTAALWRDQDAVRDVRLDPLHLGGPSVDRCLCVHQGCMRSVAASLGRLES